MGYVCQNPKKVSNVCTRRRGMAQSIEARLRGYSTAHDLMASVLAKPLCNRDRQRRTKRMNAFMLMRPPPSFSPGRSTHNNDVVHERRRGNTSLATEQTGATEMFKESSE